MSISASTRGVKSRLTPSTVRESRPIFGRSRGAAPLVGQNSERSLARGAMSGALDLGRFLVKPRVQVQRRGCDDVVRVGEAQVAQLTSVSEIDPRVAFGEHRHRL